MADTIVSARKLRGKVRSRLTRIKRDIVKLEDKEGLTPSDQRKIKRFKAQVQEYDSDFQQRHVDVLNFIEAEPSKQ